MQFSSPARKANGSLSSLKKNYEINDIELVCPLLTEIDQKVEPLRVAPRVHVVLQYQVIFKRLFLKLLRVYTFITANKLAES